MNSRKRKREKEKEGDRGRKKIETGQKLKRIRLATRHFAIARLSYSFRVYGAFLNIV